MSTSHLDSLPVIVGVGETIDRPSDLTVAKEPLDLIVDAVERAVEDARVELQHTSALHVVNVLSWPYRDLPSSICERLKIAPKSRVYGAVGGETPVTHLHQAASDIASGKADIVVVCGAEAFGSVDAAKRSGTSLPWTPMEADPPKVTRLVDVLSPLTLQHGLDRPLSMYPLYENACQHFWGQTPAEGRAESAQLWASLSRVAANNPYSWLKREHREEEIAAVSDRNRLVAWPYTKLMIAQPNVNQGCAVILTSFARARAMGVPDHRMVFIWGGASAWEPRDVLARDNYHGASSMEAVLAAASDMAGRQFDLVELYSCFPTVPKMACRSLGLPKDQNVTVTGGLTFFGAPLSNYMGHATAAMVRAMRRDEGELGLLYGQGEIVTKHHALVLGRVPPGTRTFLPIGSDAAQTQADAKRGGLPLVEPEYGGPAKIETFTVLYDRRNQPEFGVVVARTPSGARLLARVPKHDEAAIARLTQLTETAIGLNGFVRQEGDVPRWHME